MELAPDFDEFIECVTGHGVRRIGWVEGVTYEHSCAANGEAVKMLLDLGLDVNSANRDGARRRTVARSAGRRPVARI